MNPQQVHVSPARIPAYDRQCAELSARLPGWHVWYVLTLNDPRGRASWSAMLEGAGRAAVGSYDRDELVQLAYEFQAGIAGHIARTRRELDETETGNRTRLAMLQDDLAAFEKLSAR